MQEERHQPKSSSSNLAPASKVQFARKHESKQQQPVASTGPAAHLLHLVVHGCVLTDASSSKPKAIDAPTLELAKTAKMNVHEGHANARQTCPISSCPHMVRGLYGASVRYLQTDLTSCKGVGCNRHFHFCHRQTPNRSWHDILYSAFDNVPKPSTFLQPLDLHSCQQEPAALHNPCPSRAMPSTRLALIDCRPLGRALLRVHDNNSTFLRNEKSQQDLDDQPGRCGSM